MSAAIQGLDHFVLTVADADRTAAFYTGILGMPLVAFGDNRLALQAGGQKINIHVAGKGVTPHAASPRPGSGDFCLIGSRPVAELAAELESKGVPVELGPVPRTGAAGPLLSIYVRDPDGNLVEIANRAED